MGSSFVHPVIIKILENAIEWNYTLPNTSCTKTDYIIDREVIHILYCKFANFLNFMNT